MNSMIIWLSVISMTSDQGRYHPIVTPFESEEECIEETAKVVESFGERIQVEDGEWFTYGTCEIFLTPPASFGF